MSIDNKNNQKEKILKALHKAYKPYNLNIYTYNFQTILDIFRINPGIWTLYPLNSKSEPARLVWPVLVVAFGAGIFGKQVEGASTAQPLLNLSQPRCSRCTIRMAVNREKLEGGRGQVRTPPHRRRRHHRHLVSYKTIPPLVFLSPPAPSLKP
jgi:hypothetical protein